MSAAREDPVTAPPHGAAAERRGSRSDEGAVLGRRGDEIGDAVVRWRVEEKGTRERSGISLKSPSLNLDYPKLTFD
jgi:hypothetical protein